MHLVSIRDRYLIPITLQVVLSMHLRMKATNRKEETTSKWQACQAKMHAAVSLSQVVYRMLSALVHRRSQIHLIYVLS